MNVQTSEFTKSNEHSDFKPHKEHLDVKPQKKHSDFNPRTSQKEGSELKLQTSSKPLTFNLA
jgi:hypothetical protein